MTQIAFMFPYSLSRVVCYCLGEGRDSVCFAFSQWAMDDIHAGPITMLVSSNVL